MSLFCMRIPLRNLQLESCQISALSFQYLNQPSNIMLFRPFFCCLLNDPYHLQHGDLISDQDIDQLMWLICLVGALQSRQALYRTP